MFTEYHEHDMTGKLIWNFRNISHFLRGVSGGKGSRKRILTVLLKSGPVTQTALTEYLGIRPGSASEVLSKMEAGGLIVRQENENDRRTVNIELTEKGRKEALLAAEERKRAHNELLCGLSRAEQEELLFLLEKLTAHCRESCLNNNREYKEVSGKQGQGTEDGKATGSQGQGTEAEKDLESQGQGTEAERASESQGQGTEAEKASGSREHGRRDEKTPGSQGHKVGAEET